MLRLPAHDDVARWHIEPPVDYEARGRIAMRGPTDEIDVRARGRNGTWHEVTLRAQQGEVTLGEAQLGALARALGGPAQGTLAPEEIRPVVRQARPALQRCHERLMKDRPDLGGKAYRFQLRVTVGMSGVVQRTALQTDGEPPPRELERCVHAEMRRRPFPKPTGGPVTFEVPLRFQPRSVQ